MKAFVLFVSAAALACAQSTTQTDLLDAAGNRIRGPEVEIRGNVRTERLQSINGRAVPLENIEERVVSDDGRVKVIERTTKKFDQTGHLAETQRVTEEQTRLGDGNSSIRASTYRTDVNGNLQLAERSVTETRKSGTAQTSEALIERPTLD